VQTLSIFPREIIERAVDPVHGIPSKVKFLNLAEIRKHLDDWATDHYAHTERVERLTRKALPEPTPESPEMRERVAKGLRELLERLKAGSSP
jgi:hypothetical protein